MHVFGEDDSGIDAKRHAGAHPSNRVAQRVNLRYQQTQALVEQVHREEERSARNPIAAILRHSAIIRQLSLDTAECATTFPPYAC